MARSHSWRFTRWLFNLKHFHIADPGHASAIEPFVTPARDTRGLMIRSFAVTCIVMLGSVASGAAQDPIVSAMSAAPPSISAKATVMDWSFKVLRTGDNGWTCLPDRPNTPGNDPWCVTPAWIDFLHAYIAKTSPTYTDIGFAYMLMGDTPVSNADPFATEPTAPNDWVTHLGPHLMMLVPNPVFLGQISTDHLNGGPWIMWPGTPYAHIMIPIESRGGTDEP